MNYLWWRSYVLVVHTGVIFCRHDEHGYR